MRFLLDSHVFLWFSRGERRLRPTDLKRLRDPKNALYISTATIWELSIKRSLGRLSDVGSFSAAASTQNLIVLPILPIHAERVESFARHHKDPFDHLLLAQAMVEDLTLVTHDAMLARYGVPTLLV